MSFKKVPVCSFYSTSAVGNDLFYYTVLFQLEFLVCRICADYCKTLGNQSQTMARLLVDLSLILVRYVSFILMVEGKRSRKMPSRLLSKASCFPLTDSRQCKSQSSGPSSSWAPHALLEDRCPLSGSVAKALEFLPYQDELKQLIGGMFEAPANIDLVRSSFSSGSVQSVQLEAQLTLNNVWQAYTALRPDLQ